MLSTATRRAKFLFGRGHIARLRKGQIEDLARELGVAPGSEMSARLRRRYGGYAFTLWYSTCATLNGIRTVDLPGRSSPDDVRDA
jgi:hypothetical protein